MLFIKGMIPLKEVSLVRSADVTGKKCLRMSLIVWLMVFGCLILNDQALAQMTGKPLSFREQFKHAAGIGAVSFTKPTGAVFLPAVSYSPNFSFTNGMSDFSVTLGSHLTAGYYFAEDSTEEDFIYTDLPLLVELNFGHNASKDFYYDMGWFMGGGYTYNRLYDRWQSGPVATIGFRTFIFGPSFTLRYIRFFATAEKDRSTHGLSVSLNLGSYFEQVKRNNKVSRFIHTK
jgi:hypothetical protein